MTTFVLVHGAWHGPWAWQRVVPLLHDAGARTYTPDLNTGHGRGLHDDVDTVVATLDAVAGEIVLVGHSYAGLVVREAADARPDVVDHIVLVDGWAGGDGVSLFDLAPGAFVTAVEALGEMPPPPAAFGITGEEDTAWLAARLGPQPLRTFAEATRLGGAVERVPGTAIYCRPQVFPFDRFGAALGYRTCPLDGPHDVMLTDPQALTTALLDVRSFIKRK